MSGKNNSSTAYLGFGSNLGDRLAAMRTAVHVLSGHRDIGIDFPTGIASLYETTPVGGPAGQGPFLNSALRASTTLSPFDLLSVLLSIEKSLGRARRERWEARSIDIDLLLYDDAVINDASEAATGGGSPSMTGLVVPHPRLARRRFVLEPLAEIAGEVVHPVLKTTISELARQRRGGNQHTNETVILTAGRNWYGGSVLRR